MATRAEIQKRQASNQCITCGEAPPLGIIFGRVYDRCNPCLTAMQTKREENRKAKQKRFFSKLSNAG